MPIATVADIYQKLNTLAPFDSAMSWDNCGLQVGSFSTEVTGCLLALDVTNEAVEEAERIGANLIITHHPVIFHPLRSLHAEDIPYRLAQKGISLISAHTNLDLADDGVNRALADRFALSDTISFENEDGLGLIGSLPNTFTPDELALYIKSALSSPHVAYTGGRNSIRRVAIVSGAGGDYLQAALAAGADALITGEVEHNIWIDSLQTGFPLFSAGHHATEAVILSPLSVYLKQEFPEIPFGVYDSFPVQCC